MTVVFFLGLLFLFLYYGYLGRERPPSGEFDGVYYETEGTDPVCRLNQHTLTESIAFIKEKNGRVCTVEEVQKISNYFGGLSTQRTYAVAKDANTGKYKWVEVSSDSVNDEVKVFDASKTPWTDNKDYYNPN